jgi:hypothetical protein
MRILVGGHLLGLFATHDFLSGEVADRGHLFLSFSVDGSLDANDLIIRRGPVNNDWLGNAFGPIEMQINVSYVASYENPNSWAFGHPNPQSLFEAPLSISYDSELLSNFDISAAWESLSYLAEQIGATGLDYDLIHQNSNSVVGTLLGILGFGPFQPGFEVPGGSTAYYPAVGQPLTGDWLTGGNISYTIRGGYATIPGTDGEFVELPLADRLFALNSEAFFPTLQTGDFVTTFGGNDELHDGNRRDTLEGGAGDDRYILLDDSAADIIISGEGDDILSGGGAQDRIVLRIDVLDQMYEDWVATLPEGTILLGDNAKKPSERLGDSALTSGIPILGGFWDMGVEGTEAFRLQTGSFATGVYDPLNPTAANWQTFSQLLYTYSYTDENGEQHTGTILPFGYSFRMEGADLVITFAYGPNEDTEEPNDLQEHTITIRDWQDGDFGIHVMDQSVIVVPGNPIWGLDVLEQDVIIEYEPAGAFPYVGDSAHVAS